MSDKVTSSDVKAWLPSYKVSNLSALKSVVVKWDSGELKDYRLYVAFAGISYAVNTCRVSGLMVQALNSMKRRDLWKLVARVANECPTIGEVPRWLINNVKTGEQG